MQGSFIATLAPRAYSRKIVISAVDPGCRPACPSKNGFDCSLKLIRDIMGILNTPDIPGYQRSEGEAAACKYIYIYIYMIEGDFVFSIRKYSWLKAPS